MINTEIEIIKCSKVNELNDKVIELFIQVITENISKKNNCNIAISGGSTPIPIFKKIANNYSTFVDWTKVKVFWVDERSVPPSHPDSNFGNANQSLLKFLQGIQFFRMKGEIDTQDAATEYQEILKSELPISEGFPVFDLMLMGMGEDGHTASLFPGTRILYEKKKWVESVWVAKKNTFRISLTIPVIDNSKVRIFAFHGEKKDNLFQEMLNSSDQNYPLELLNFGNQRNIFIISKNPNDAN